MAEARLYTQRKHSSNVEWRWRCQTVTHRRRTRGMCTFYRCRGIHGEVKWWKVQGQKRMPRKSKTTTTTRIEEFVGDDDDATNKKKNHSITNRACVRFEPELASVVEHPQNSTTPNRWAHASHEGNHKYLMWMVLLLLTFVFNFLCVRASVRACMRVFDRWISLENWMTKMMTATMTSNDVGTMLMLLRNGTDGRTGVKRWIFTLEECVWGDVCVTVGQIGGSWISFCENFQVWDFDSHLVEEKNIYIIFGICEWVCDPK